jgi:hypothetical protein
MDTLKKLAEITTPDPRSLMSEMSDEKTGRFRPKTIEDHYAVVNKIILHEGVPEKIREHFETTKNLLLYSWFVYRFMPVADFHAAVTLEYALKTKAEGKVRGLYNLIDHAIKNNWVRNEGFSVWRNKKRMVEEQKRIYEELSKLTEHEVSFHEEPYDYLDVLKKAIPHIRNAYGHGESMLYPGVYGKLDICAEFINQLFDSPS